MLYFLKMIWDPLLIVRKNKPLKSTFEPLNIDVVERRQQRHKRLDSQSMSLSIS